MHDCQTTWTRPKCIFLVAVAAMLGDALTPASVRGQQQTPFAAFVSSRGAPMRCGPGEQFYVTGHVQPGMEVTVHRRVPGGWLGIRPSVDSFCWVPNDDLRVAPDGATAEVVRDGVVPWIAAMGGRAPDRWQVRLHIGESVKVIGPAERLPLNGQAPRWWRRIAPPSGEFRWIRESDLSEPPGRIVVANQVGSQDETKLSNPSSFVRRESPRLKSVSHRQPQSANRDASDSRSAAPAADGLRNPNLDRMERAAQRLEDAFDKLDALVKPAQFRSWRKRGESDPAEENLGPEAAADSPQDVRFRNRNRNAVRPPKKQSNKVNDKVSSGDSELDDDTMESEDGNDEPPLIAEKLNGREFHRELVRLDADLSLMVAKPLNSWRLAGLKRRAVILSQSGPSALDRGRAALLLDSIHGFDQLHVRRLAADDEARRSREFAQRNDDSASTSDATAISNSRTTDSGPKELNVESVEVLDEDPMRISEPTGSGLRRPAQLGQPERESRDEPQILDRTAEDQPRYDAKGVLKRVTSERRIAPPYALVDGNGDILTLVAPAPGLNLRSYVGKTIGVFGPQRKLPSFKRNLVTAQRVVRMDRIR